MLLYSLKRVKRGWRVFTFLFVGIIISTTLFAGTNIGTTQIMTGIINENINSVHVDIVAENYDYIPQQSSLEQIKSLNHIESVERFGRCRVKTNITNEESYFVLVGLQQDTRLSSGIDLVKGKKDLGANETIIPADSTIAKNVKIGDTIFLNITWYNFTLEEIKYKLYPLKVVGFVILNETVKHILDREFSSNNDFHTIQLVQYDLYSDYIIVNINTFDNYHKAKEKYTTYSSYNNYILIWVDRSYYVNTYDIETSIQRLKQLKYQINNIVYNSYVQNILYRALLSASFMILFIRYQLFITSIPIFFMAWYMGTILSSLTYNLRRREIGLLQTKGFEPKRIKRMFLIEGLFIGIISGIIGIFTGYIASSFTISREGFSNIFSGVGSDTIITTIIAGAIFGIITVYGPAGRASKMKVLDALRQYIYIEENAPYRNKLAVISLILGTYKIIVWACGISIIEVIYSINYSNIFLNIILTVCVIIDIVLSYIGPLLFFYGFSKIFVQKSISFKKKIEAFSSVLYGELGRLASKEISRNAVRNASVAFILSLIIGYSVSTTIYSASNIDYMNRRIYSSVGSDISIKLVNPANMSYALNNISSMDNVENVAGVYSCNIHYTIGIATLKVINGSDWLSTAYYEKEWFSDSPDELFESIETSHSIILEKLVAYKLGVNVGDHVYITVGTKDLDLIIVGLFGPEPVIISSGGSPYAIAESTWSFVSWNTINNMLGDEFEPDYAQILIKTTNLQQSDSITNRLKNYTTFVSSIASVYYLQQQLTKSYYLSINIRVSQLLMLFAIILAIVGSFIIVQVSLSEKRREIALISVRGFSIRQIASMLLAETSVIFIIALSLGVFIGSIMAYGGIASQRAMYSTLIIQKFAINTNVILTIIGFIGAIFLSIIIPVFMASRRGIKDFETLR